MFGLSKREQYQKAEKHAAELLTSLAQTALESAAQIKVAELTKEAAALKAKAESELQAKLDKAEAQNRAYHRALAELALYFTSSNSVPIDQATIKASDFQAIVRNLPTFSKEAS